MKKCYQYDNKGYFQFETSDYGQGLPHNATYIEPLKDRTGYLRKFQEGAWVYEEIPKENIHTPTHQELLDLLNAWLVNKSSEIASNLALDLSSGLTLEEAQDIAAEDTEKITVEYQEKLKAIQAGKNPFEEV